MGHGNTRRPVEIGIHRNLYTVYITETPTERRSINGIHDMTNNHEV